MEHKETERKINITIIHTYDKLAADGFIPSHGSLIVHVGCVGKLIRGVSRLGLCLSVCVCLSVRTLKEKKKRLELSTPNLVRI